MLYHRKVPACSVVASASSKRKCAIRRPIWKDISTVLLPVFRTPFTVVAIAGETESLRMKRTQTHCDTCTSFGDTADRLLVNLEQCCEDPVNLAHLFQCRKISLESARLASSTGLFVGFQRDTRNASRASPHRSCLSRSLNSAAQL